MAVQKLLGACRNTASQQAGWRLALSPQKFSRKVPHHLKWQHHINSLSRSPGMGLDPCALTCFAWSPYSVVCGSPALGLDPYILCLILSSLRRSEEGAERHNTCKLESVEKETGGRE